MLDVSLSTAKANLIFHKEMKKTRTVTASILLILIVVASSVVVYLWASQARPTPTRLIVFSIDYSFDHDYVLSVTLKIRFQNNVSYQSFGGRYATPSGHFDWKTTVPISAKVISYNLDFLFFCENGGYLAPGYSPTPERTIVLPDEMATVYVFVYVM